MVKLKMARQASADPAIESVLIEEGVPDPRRALQGWKRRQDDRGSLVRSQPRSVR